MVDRQTIAIMFPLRVGHLRGKLLKIYSQDPWIFTSKESLFLKIL